MAKTYGSAEVVIGAGEDIDLTADGGAIVAVDNNGSLVFLKDFAFLDLVNKFFTSHQPNVRFVLL